MRLANEKLVLEFDDRTGSLIQIEDPRDGRRLLAAPQDGLLFRVVAPDEDRWIDQYWDSHECPPPRITESDGQLTLAYDVLPLGNGQPSGIGVRVTVALPAGADEARFTVEIDNASPFMVHEVWFPRVGGWRTAGEMTLGCMAKIDPFKIRYGWAGGGFTLCEYHRRRYYDLVPTMELPMVDISGEGFGLSNILYAERTQSVGFLVQDLNEHPGDSRPAWAWVHKPFVAPGEKWSSAPVGLAPHCGDWHATADRLRKWLATWWSPPAAPERLRSAIGYFNIYSREFGGRELNPIRSLPEIARCAKEHGIQDLCVWDVIMNTYLKPGHGAILDDEPGRLEEFREALGAIRQMGIQVSTLVNLRLLSRKYAPWDQFGEARAMRTLYGQPVNEMWSSIRTEHAGFLIPNLDEVCGVLCQSHPDFQRWALKMVESLLDLGFSSLFIDQPFESNNCFGVDHGHRPGAFGHAGVCEWIPKAAELIRQRDSEGYAIGENSDIWNTQHIQLWWTWAWRAMLPEVFRYVLPDSIQSWIIDAFEHQAEMNRAFALGYLLSINVRGIELPLGAVPEFASRVKRLAELRRRTADFTVKGRFLGRYGLSVSGSAIVEAAIYDAGGRFGIIVGEIDEKSGRGGDVELAIDLPRLGQPAPRSLLLHREDGATEPLDARQADGMLKVAFRLGHWEAVVIEGLP